MRPYLVALAVATAISADAAPSGAADQRIQSVRYTPDSVVSVQAAEGYALLVEFAEDERIESVILGDSALWHVTPNKRGDRLVIKPSPGAPTTDLVVTTDMRRYVFILQLATGADGAPFVLHFDYPAAAPPPSALPVAYYGFRGAKELFPLTMSDDGTRTIIRWKPDSAMPAVTARDAEGREAIVNGRMVNGDYQIDGTAPIYIFRRGKAQAVAARQADRKRTQ